MSLVKFYLDKAGKTQQYPIHLVLRCKGVNIKVATGIKVKKKDWDPKTQTVKPDDYAFNTYNTFMGKLRYVVESFIEKTPNATDTNVKKLVKSFVDMKKKNLGSIIAHENKSYLEGKEPVTFIDLFAGAGGFSEGFLQAETCNRYYDFLLASDINENCELTHVARYNHQLRMDAEFLRQDITEPDFLDNLLNKIKGRRVDVVCGGPPCQSFSLAGKRKKFDKKDDLFAHYLNVIRQLRPKYFVMENVKGILTKEQGKIKEMVLQEIRSIVDLTEFHQIIHFVELLRKAEKEKPFLLESYLLRLQFETATDKELNTLRDRFIQNIESRFRILTPKIVDYKTSKTDIGIATIRHGFNLLKRSTELAYVRKKVILEKAFSDLDNDNFAADFDAFLTAIEMESIVERIHQAFDSLQVATSYKDEIDEIIQSLMIYTYSFDECVTGLEPFAKKKKKDKELHQILSEIRLYNIDQPFVALASNYGVPQNRERVLFIGCRKDQKLIHTIPPTVTEKEKVNVFEALYDLDFIGNDEEKYNYETIDLKSKYNGSTEKMKSLVRKRAIGGQVSENGKSYAEWSREGRLNGRFSDALNPFYVRNFEELDNKMAHHVVELHNHKTSNQNNDVIKRLDTILQAGDYDLAKLKLKKIGLDSEKRNYNVLKPDAQSPTVMTIPDDYIHFSSPRALTVREMARLQSFDDSFVFQGKRSTGGNKRKMEVPQFTLVGNAVPPLMARAVALEVLKHIQ